MQALQPDLHPSPARTEPHPQASQHQDMRQKQETIIWIQWGPISNPARQHPELRRADFKPCLPTSGAKYGRFQNLLANIRSYSSKEGRFPTLFPEIGMKEESISTPTCLYPDLRVTCCLERHVMSRIIIVHHYL